MLRLMKKKGIIPVRALASYLSFGLRRQNQ
jgi:hypothetical protein